MCSVQMYFFDPPLCKKWRRHSVWKWRNWQNFTSFFFCWLRWTRREEADFYRVVSTFGVVFDPERGRFDWTKFRAMARLHKKTDESLEKYLYAFMSMCRRVCRLPSKEGGCVCFYFLNLCCQCLPWKGFSFMCWKIKMGEEELRIHVEGKIESL